MLSVLVVDDQASVRTALEVLFDVNDIPVMITYHPSYLLRPYNQDAKREAWEDLKKVLHFVYD